MTELTLWAVTAGAVLAAVPILSLAALGGWRSWLAFGRFELETGRQTIAPGWPAARIELADLRERVRKLEAIAAGVDL